MREAMYSGLRYTPSVKRKSQSLRYFLFGWPNGKLGFLVVLAQACCVYISSKGRSSSSVFKLPCQTCMEIQESGVIQQSVSDGR